MARAALFAATLAVAVALASASGPATWYDCTPAGAIGNVTGVTINPNPPAVGVTTTVTGTGTLTGTVRCVVVAKGLLRWGRGAWVAAMSV